MLFLQQQKKLVCFKQICILKKARKIKNSWKSKFQPLIMKQPEIQAIKSTDEFEIRIQRAVLFNTGHPRRTVKEVNSFVNVLYQHYLMCLTF